MHIRRAFRYLFVTRRWVTTVVVTGIICLAFLTIYTTFFVRKSEAPRDAFTTDLAIPPVAERTRQVCYFHGRWGHQGWRSRTLSPRPKTSTCVPGKTIHERLRIKNSLTNFPKGRFTYNRLKTMWRDVPETVVLKLNLASETTPTIPPSLRGEPKVGETAITPEMSVELRGTAGLVVKPSGPVRKRISNIAPTAWQWDVTPKTEKEQIMTLIIYIHVDDKEPFTLKTFEDEIHVKVTTWQQVKDVISEINPVWAFFAGAIPAIWAAWKWIRRQPRKSQKKTN